MANQIRVATEILHEPFSNTVNITIEVSCPACAEELLVDPTDPADFQAPNFAVIPCVCCTCSAPFNVKIVCGGMR